MFDQIAVTKALLTELNCPARALSTVTGLSDSRISDALGGVKTAPERIQLLYDTAHDLQRLVALFNPAPLDFRRGVELRSLLSAMRSNRLKVTITIDEPTSAIQSFSVFVTDSEGNQAAYFERLSAEGDLTGIFCTSGSEREFTQEERWYADEEIQAGADRDAATAD